MTTNKRTRKAVLEADPVMAALVRAAGPMRLGTRPAHPPFESLGRAIAHQQLHGTAAERILGRLCEQLGGGKFPSPQTMLDAQVSALRAVGFSGAKVLALQDLARRSLDGTVLDWSGLEALSDDEIVERISSVRGIGRWTVEMLLLFSMRRPDVWPVDDFGVRNGFRLAFGLKRMPTPAALREYGERWRPWRSAAAWYLWRAVDLSRQQRLPAHPKGYKAPRLAMVKAQKPVTKPPRRRRSLKK